MSEQSTQNGSSATRAAKSGQVSPNEAFNRAYGDTREESYSQSGLPSPSNVLMLSVISGNISPNALHQQSQSTVLRNGFMQEEVGGSKIPTFVSVRSGLSPNGSPLNASTISKKKPNFKHQSHAGFGTSNFGIQTNSSENASIFDQSEITEVQIDQSVFSRVGSQANISLKKIQQARKTEQLVKELIEVTFNQIGEDRSEHALINSLKINADIKVNEIIDPRGYTLLHEACFNNNEQIVEALIKHAKETLTTQQLSDWINHKTKVDGFTSLHFTSFKGNPQLSELLLTYGADINAVNNFGINVLHVAAQGDQPISLYFFKLRGLDLRSRDNRGSTALHWACYSKSEVALVYLLSWVTVLDDQDCEGYTPLHLAVKSVETLKSTRPVRSLLIRGAPRNMTDNQDRKPVDLAQFITTPHLKESLIADLAPPKDWSCLMLKTPMKLVKKSYKTPMIMWFMMFAVYALLVVFAYPFYVDQSVLVWTQLGLFMATFVIHTFSLCKDPGYLQKPKNITFLQMMMQFDPVLLCPDCEIIRTDRSRHCSICNQCTERFDHHCPWINNCVGSSNHGLFMTFIFLMATLLLTTFVSLIVNFDCYENNVGNAAVRDASGLNFFMPLLLSYESYSKAWIMTANIIALLITGFFLLPVMLLTAIQTRNFCLNKTTSERFAKNKNASTSRTSTYLTSGSEAEIELLGGSVIEAMQTRDHSTATMPCLYNCYDMCCNSKQPDQKKIYLIQSHKNQKIQTRKAGGMHDNSDGSGSPGGNENPIGVKIAQDLEITEDFAAYEQKGGFKLQTERNGTSVSLNDDDDDRVDEPFLNHNRNNKYQNEGGQEQQHGA